MDLGADSDLSFTKVECRYSAPTAAAFIANPMPPPDLPTADVAPDVPVSQTPTVSIVVPVYNGRHTVSAAIDSLLQQAGVGVEVVVIDDGSTDGTADVLLRYAGEPRVRVIHHGVNLGLVAALNRGVIDSRTELVARLDADDRALPGRLAAQVAAMSADPALVLHATAYERALPSGEVVRSPTPPLSHGALAMAAWSGNRLCHSAVMFRRQAVVDIGGYRAEWFPVEDFDLWLRLLDVGEYRGSSVVGTHYLVNPQGISRLHGDVQRRTMRSRTDDLTVALLGDAVPTGSVRARLRHLERYRRAVHRRLAERGISTGGIDQTAAALAFECTVGRPRLVRHLQVASAAPRLWFEGRFAGWTRVRRGRAPGSRRADPDGG